MGNVAKQRLDQQRARRDLNRDKHRQRNRDWADRYGYRFLERMKSIPAPRKGRYWTPEEDAILGQDNLSNVECCFLLGRSYSAVSCRRRKVISGRATYFHLRDTCANGHRFTADNTRIRTGTMGRRCLTCQRDTDASRNVGATPRHIWTERDILLLRNTSLTANDISERLVISAGAVRQQRSRLGVHTTSFKVWTDEEVNTLICLRPTYTLDEIAIRLGCSRNQVKRKWEVINKNGR